MDTPLEPADLVEHADRPGSYGFIEERLDADRFLVHWIGKDKVIVPEVCGLTELRRTSCPDCGEEQCWCGVGR